MIRNKIRTATVTVKEDILFPSQLIENSKGNRVRKDRVLKAGTYTTENYYHYSDRYDSHLGTRLVIDGYTFFIQQSQVGNTTFNRAINCPLQHVELEFK